VHLAQHTQAYDFASRSACRGRRLIITSRGFLAMCPRATQKDDLICVLRGGKAPFVLRKEGKHYTLIGECYVDGIMYGEILAPPFNSPQVRETSRIEMLSGSDQPQTTRFEIR
jgi:hypothetical protein